MTSPEKALIKRILARHGARPDLRLWRNETGLFWAGTMKGNLGSGAVVLKNPSRVMAGLCKGSADLVGLKVEELPVAGGAGEVTVEAVGRFVGLEVKTGRQKPSDAQKKWIALVEELGGIAGVVRSVEDVDEILGEP